jgi:hypothetical protein
MERSTGRVGIRAALSPRTTIFLLIMVVGVVLIVLGLSGFASAYDPGTACATAPTGQACTSLLEPTMFELFGGLILFVIGLVGFMKSPKTKPMPHPGPSPTGAFSSARSPPTAPTGGPSVFCTACGTSLASDAGFCYQCGAKVAM